MQHLLKLIRSDFQIRNISTSLLRFSIKDLWNYLQNRFKATDEAIAALQGSAGGTVTLPLTAAPSSTSANRLYLVDTSNSAFSAPLPVSPKPGDTLTFIDEKSKFDLNNLTLTSADKIMGLNEPLICDVRGAAVTLVYLNGSWTLQ